jgi:hypothetical protein
MHRCTSSLGGRVRRPLPGTLPAPAGPARYRVRWRGATFFARQLQGEDEAPHGRHADAQASLGEEPRTSLGPRGLWWRMHEMAHLGQCRLIAARSAATRMRTGGDISGRSAPPEQLLNTGETDPKEGSNGALRAESLIRGPEDLLSEVTRGGFHTQEHNVMFPSIQSRTALVIGHLGARSLGILATKYQSIQGHRMHHRDDDVHSHRQSRSDRVCATGLRVE